MVRCDYSRLKTFCDKLPGMSLIVLKIITLALSVKKKSNNLYVEFFTRMHCLGFVFWIGMKFCLGVIQLLFHDTLSR